MSARYFRTKLERNAFHKFNPNIKLSYLIENIHDIKKIQYEHRNTLKKSKQARSKNRLFLDVMLYLSFCFSIGYFLPNSVLFICVKVLIIFTTTTFVISKPVGYKMFWDIAIDSILKFIFQYEGKNY